MHVQFVIAERKVYKSHQAQAKMFPEIYLSICMDGMDCQKTSMPHFKQGTKVVDSGYPIKNHVNGVLMHGHKPYAIMTTW
jgi:hypothetical protein